MNPSISVVFATFRRIDTLVPTLESFCGLPQEGPTWEVVVVDNADDQVTQAVLCTFEKRLPLRWLVERRCGKNFALNTALEHVLGELVVFTDDDVLPETNWLKEVSEGAARWPQAAIFSGRILPSSVPEHVRESKYARAAYGIADWPQEEGRTLPGRVWGANMAVRRDVFRAGHRYDPRIGPAGSNYVMGSETEFVRRMARLGYETVYLPAAVVTHQIRPEQLSMEWLRQRVFRQGRGAAWSDNSSAGRRIGGVPRHLWRELLQTRFSSLGARALGQKVRAIEADLDYWFARGQVYEYRRSRRHDR